MTIINQDESRLEVEDLGDRLRIALRPKRNCFTIGFLSFWLLGWTVGEIFGGSMLIKGLLTYLQNGAFDESLGSWGSTAFLLFWLAFWTLGGAFALFNVGYQLVGREVIEATYDGLTISKQLFSIGRRKHYTAVNIDGLQLFKAARPTGLPSFAAGMLGAASITFTYGNQSVTIGAGSRAEDTEQAYQVLIERFPVYRSAQAEV